MNFEMEASMRSLILTVLLVSYAANSATALAKQPGLLDLLSHTIEGLVPCLPPCLLNDIKMTYDNLAPCALKAMNELEDFFNKSAFRSYREFYDNVLVNEDGPSLICRYFDDVSPCFDKAVTDMCGPSVASRFKNLHIGLRSYANCEEDMLPMLQCLAHPDLVSPGSNTGYAKCVGDLVEEINKKYLIDGVFYWEHFYNEAITKEGGAGFKTLLMSFGTCIDVKVVALQGCGGMEYKLINEFKAIQTFVDYSGKGTDCLTCFGNPNVHLAYTKCYSRLTEDLVYSPPPIFPGTALSNVTQYLEHLDVRENWQVVLLWMRNHYLGFDTCIQSSTERHCDFHWSTKEIISILKPTDDFFTALRPAVNGPDCQIPSASGSEQGIPRPTIYLTLLTAYGLFRL